MRTFRHNWRPAFTLIEILVVLALIGVLAGLAIYFVPSFQTSERAARGGSNVQGWLQAARQRAIRDKAPRGIRLLYDATLDGWNRAQYLEQPDDLGGGSYYDTVTTTFLNLQLRPPPDNSANKVWVTNNNGTPAFNFGPKVNGRLSGQDGVNFTADDPPAQVGDYLEIDGVGLSHYIMDSARSDPIGAPTRFDMLVLAFDLPQRLTTNASNFRIMRRPRAVGDEIFDLPKTIYIDRAVHNGYASTLNFLEGYGAGDLDIMFSPTGAVMPGGYTKQHIVLWVRSTDYANALEGEPTLVVIYINSGLVAAYPANPGNTGNPYDLVK